MDDNDKKPITRIDASVGAKLRQLREASHLTPSQFAAKMKLSTQQLLDFESGKCRISAAQLWQFCQIFNVTPSDFYADIPQLNESPNKPVGPTTLHDKSENYR